jgi:predicted dehydrogenase
VVQDKLWLPGLLKLQRLVASGFFGRILSVRGEFGYWVFEGDWQEAQRPSWNYRREDGGGIIDDMLCHWRYVLDNIFGAVERVSCLGATHIPERRDEQGKAYAATADDAAYATFELAGGIIAHVNSSWCVRVRRDELVTFQVDGTKGSAVAGLRRCYVQPREATPKPVWNPDVEQPHDFFSDWQEVPDNRMFDNAFKVQWEHFMRHRVKRSFRGDCSKAPRACSSRSWVSKAGRNAAGSTCRLWIRERGHEARCHSVDPAAARRRRSRGVLGA